MRIYIYFFVLSFAVGVLTIYSATDAIKHEICLEAGKGYNKQRDICFDANYFETPIVVPKSAYKPYLISSSIISVILFISIVGCYKLTMLFKNKLVKPPRKEKLEILRQQQKMLFIVAPLAGSMAVMKYLGLFSIGVFPPFVEAGVAGVALVFAINVTAKIKKLEIASKSERPS